MPTLEIDFQSYWISGSGRGEGFAVDVETILDEDGLPFLPGRHVKGVLRDAVRKLLEIRTDEDPQIPDWLFGVGTRTAARLDRPGAGLLSVRDARLPNELRSAAIRNPTLRGRMFRTLASTAIQEQGIAKAGSLRTLRVAVPLLVLSDISFDTDRLASLPPHAASLEVSWSDLVDRALVFVTALGAGRHKGFGQAAVSIAP